MPVYGYRLFVVQLYEGMTHTPIKFADCGGRHYRDIAVELLTEVQGQTLVQPRKVDLVADDDVVDGGPQESAQHPLAGRKAMSVDVLHPEGDLIYGEVLVGTFGDHEAALAAPPELVEVSPEQDVAATGEDGDELPAPALTAEALRMDLTGRAPARRYRFVLNLPDDGQLGALIVEDISRSCPVDLIIGWLRRRGKSAGELRLAQLPETATAAERKAASTYWRPTATAAIDDQYFTDMLDQGQLNRVELVRHSIAPDGSRAIEDLRLTAPRPEALTPVGDLVDLAVGWYEQVKARRQAKSEGVKKRLTKEEREAAKAEARMARQQTDQEAAEEIAALLGQAVADLNFDDGWLVLQDGERTKRISPSRISELFIYEIDRDRRPPNLDFYRHGRGRALRLATPLQLHLTWPTTIAVEP